jgi:hypothetical protein
MLLSVLENSNADPVALQDLSRQPPWVATKFQDLFRARLASGDEWTAPTIEALAVTRFFEKLFEGVRKCVPEDPEVGSPSSCPSLSMTSSQRSAK